MGLKDRAVHSRAGIQGKKLNDVRVAHLGAPIVATVNRILAATDWADGTPAIAAQPDTPRNITCTLTDANASVSAGVLTVVGQDPEGRTISEVITYTAARAGFTGTKVFAKVTSLTLAGAAGGAAGVDTYVIGVGNVIGLPCSIPSTSCVKHTFLGAVRQASPTVTAGTSTSGVNASGGTYDGSKQMLVYYSPGLASATR